MEYNIIESGSSGNAILVNKIILLDCGVAYSKIKSIIKNVKVIFISHLWLHSDHCKDSTIKKIAFEHPRIKFITCKENAKHLLSLGVAKQNVFALDFDKWFDIGICKVRLEQLFHDVENAALKIDFNGFKCIYIVDTNECYQIDAKDYDYAWVEANYSTDEELQEKIREAEENGEFTYLKRVLHTHLSQLDALNWLQKNNITNYRFIHEHKTKEGKEANNVY